MPSRYPLRILDNKYTPFILRLILGGIFIYAAGGKILYPAEFSEAIANYQMIPVMANNFIAVTLPWVELIAGLLLFNGFKTQSATTIILLCLFVFSIGAIFALARGLDINCGCFTEASRRVGLVFLAEEAGMFLMGGCILFFDKGFLSIDNLLRKYQSQSSPSFQY
jgi:putative oxidoreductase